MGPVALEALLLRAVLFSLSLAGECARGRRFTPLGSNGHSSSKEITTATGYSKQNQKQKQTLCRTRMTI